MKRLWRRITGSFTNNRDHDQHRGDRLAEDNPAAGRARSPQEVVSVASGRVARLRRGHLRSSSVARVEARGGPAPEGAASVGASSESSDDSRPPEMEKPTAGPLCPSLSDGRCSHCNSMRLSEAHAATAASVRQELIALADGDVPDSRRDKQQPPVETINAEINFYQGMCMHCKRAPELGTSFSRCSRCKTVKYCSPAHQKLHWKRHRRLCRALVRENGESVFACGVLMDDDDTWRQYLQQTESEVADALKRPLTFEESSMFQFPPVCRVCRTMSNLHQCSQCCMVQYCSPAHSLIDEISHGYRCFKYVQALLCDRYLYKCDMYGIRPTYPPLLPKPKAQHNFLGENIRTLLRNQIAEYDPTPENPQQGSSQTRQDNRISTARLLWMTETLTYPLTVLYTVEEIALDLEVRRKEAMVIHVMKITSPVDCWLYSRWEHLMHRLPQIRVLRLELFNFEKDSRDLLVDRLAEVRQLCPDCVNCNRELHINVHTTSYPLALKDDNYQPPDLLLTCDNALSKDCGLGTWQGPLAEAAVPVMITSCRLELLHDEIKKLTSARKYTTQQLLRPHSNPFRSCRPLATSVRPEGAYFLNCYLCVLQLTTKRTLPKISEDPETGIGEDGDDGVAGSD